MFGYLPPRSLLLAHGLVLQLVLLVAELGLVCFCQLGIKTDKCAYQCELWVSLVKCHKRSVFGFASA